MARLEQEIDQPQQEQYNAADALRALAFAEEKCPLGVRVLLSYVREPGMPWVRRAKELRADQKTVRAARKKIAEIIPEAASLFGWR